MTAAYGGSAKEAGLDGNIVRATQLEEIAARPAKK
jgi:heterodisulfide reductase subunit B